MEFFLKYKIVILRSVGGLMLVIGFAVHFWSVPEKGLSANAKAAANISRMESKMAAKGSGSKKSFQKNDASFLKELKRTQAKQLRYLTIMAMILGVGSLGYTFLPKKDKEA